ncbi:ATP-dependent RecD-like DNA helicase [Acetivibrio thermocellus]|uniref:SF1B family DNA helicase RecD2 n=1 Tax=Acetivibrio thermocellus TaxID=1515 RepID=UPI0021AE2C6E|nr:ATP-dependent RecD-like DNA helicase [Acetivibrio thermocellus]UWV48497.1 ATP-dependent RecD-like DNA helicase [Acetivibrio thermocellus]
MVTIEGTVEEIIFSNEANGYTVCEIKCDKEVITVVGYMPFINVGETLRVSGKWVIHPDYGEQLKVELYEKLLPETPEAIERYLASGLIKGVGPATAKKIVKKFADQTLHIISHHPQRLAEIKGITMEKALRIGQAFEEQRGLRDVVLFLQEYGISPTYCAKIYKTFGPDTIEEIRKNPYRLSDEIFGISFRTADRIAKSLGIDPYSKYRISSGIKYVLSRAATEGHTFLEEEMLKSYTSKLLDINIDSIEDALVSLVLNKSVYVDRNDGMSKIYLSSFYHAELGVCRKLVELSQVRYNADMEDFEERIKQVQKKEGIILADKQKEAIREAMTNGVLVITGGPGTGKTTIIKSIISLLESEGYEFALAAPTGRAAKRMSEATGYEAKTIHRLLEIGYTSNEDELVFMRTEDNPIEADVVIIDEMSMVDIILMYHLLKAIVCGTRLILVGDVDQLPSVGPGNVLRDIIKSGMIKTVKLSEIFRQAGESMIVVNAHRINRGEHPILNEREKDFFFVTRNSQNDILKTVVDLCTRRIPDTYGYDPMKQIQVLTPMRKGTVGVANLNIELQKVLNPEDGKKKQKAFRNYVFREGDRVMQIKNNYNLRWEKINGPGQEGAGVFNGDMGIIVEIDDEEQKIKVLFDDEKLVEYDYTILDELEPAYAVTIHKSQGSEFPVVILPVFPGPSVLMTRNLLYTAITRARELVILVGNKDCLYGMIMNDRETKRNSDLAEKLRKCIVGVDWLKQW